VYGVDRSSWTKPVPTGLAPQQLVSVPASARPDADAQRSGHRVFESCGSCDLVRVWGGSRWARLRVADDFGFEFRTDQPLSAAR